ncbi:related to Gluconolactonase [Melanopsichium pennsylvanicum]|uniref:Related to Gluconolactonase n=2 Tax=Melanopsichium pennsylvanicum TaxID=63383 RepID=A0AAJ4XRG8_9BASI|nr:related to Gluconolactonase [Melanopsichium pennsylvanicum 4]SNX86571.1 related to Gluconolactonase [Melanopsichium pennsylvanicum]
MSPDQSEHQVGIVSLDADFNRLIGTSASMRKLLVDPKAQQTFHEAGIYLPKHDKVYISSNRLPHNQHGQHAVIVGVPLSHIPPSSTSVTGQDGILSELTSEQQEKLWSALEIIEDVPSHLAMPNGATVWDDNSLLWCEQGLDARNVASALVIHNVNSHKTTSALKNYHGKPFSSLNDAVKHPTTGCIFFTDPDYGVEQSFKSHQIDYAPNGVYVWNPETNQVQLLDASNYVKPNGVTFVPSPSNDGSGLLITTDTGRFRFHRNDKMGDFYVDETAPSLIYSYQVHADSASKDGLPAVDVRSRRVFAQSTSGVPDGIHVDTQGNVWAGHGNGVHVYRPNEDGSGKLIGKFILPGGKGVANFCWAGKVNEGQYRQLLFAEDELWEVIIGVNGQD